MVSELGSVAVPADMRIANPVGVTSWASGDERWSIDPGALPVHLHRQIRSEATDKVSEVRASLMTWRCRLLRWSP